MNKTVNKIIRLDRFVSEYTKYSRAEAKRLISASRIHINGKLIKQASTKVNIESDTICLDEQAITVFGPLYIMLNKPSGYVSATEDGDHPTVIDLLGVRCHFLGSDDDYARIQREQLQIVGRLDKDTTGLLLLTNDGNWNHRITSPNSDCPKTYFVTLSEPIQASLVDIFHEGILLRNEEKKTKPAILDIQNEHQAYITIQEGRYHQVKRMFAACGNKVTGLKRKSIGSLDLDNDLDDGAFRLLSDSESSLF